MRWCSGSASWTFLLGLLAKVFAIGCSYPLAYAQARLHAQDKAKAKATGAVVQTSVTTVLAAAINEKGLLEVYKGLGVWKPVACTCSSMAVVTTERSSPH